MSLSDSELFKIVFASYYFKCWLFSVIFYKTLIYNKRLNLSATAKIHYQHVNEDILKIVTETKLKLKLTKKKEEKHV